MSSHVHADRPADAGMTGTPRIGQALDRPGPGAMRIGSVEDAGHRPAVPDNAAREQEVAAEPAGRGELAQRADAVHVRVRLEQDSEVPELVLCGRRLWCVRKILAHDLTEPGPAGALAEHIWWVVVAMGPTGADLVCELGQEYPSGRWRLRSIVEEMPSRFQYVG